MIIEGTVQGDTINLECSIDLESGETLTNWKIRCEIYDECQHSIKLATANSGGSTSQIEITDADEGEFTIKIAKTLTDNFDKRANIEIEVENSSGELFTPIIGEENEIIFSKQKINWSTPG